MICVFRCVLATLCHFQKSIWDSGTKQRHTNMRKTELAQLLGRISLRKLNGLFILLAGKDRKMSVPVHDELCDIVKSLRQHIIHGKAVAEFLCAYPQCGSPPKHRSLPSFHTQKLPRWTIALTLEKNQNTCPYSAKIYHYYSISGKSTSFLALKHRSRLHAVMWMGRWLLKRIFQLMAWALPWKPWKRWDKLQTIPGNAPQHQCYPAAIPEPRAEGGGGTYSRSPDHLVPMSNPA